MIRFDFKETKEKKENMREIRIILEDAEYEKVIAKKGADTTWKQLFLNGLGIDSSA